MQSRANWIGVDLHSRVVQVCVLDDSGEPCFEKRYRGSSLQEGLELVRELADRFPGARLAVEALGSNRWFVAAAREHGLEVTVTHAAHLCLKPESAPAGLVTLDPARRVADRAPGDDDRLAELERRVAALEHERASQRAPASARADQPPSQDELRKLVLDLVAAEREARKQADEREQERVWREEREFDARYKALMFAQEHGLADWQRDRFAELFVETAERTAEIEKSIDPLNDDPAAVEARWTEFDEWVDRRERELTLQLDPELYRKLYGEN